jgi:4-hydroxy-3-methylbut-2-enyl diphosphate reductase
VVAVLPALAAQNGRPLTCAAVFLWAAGLVFCRTAFFDILDMQGDRIVGKETLPTLLGDRKTFLLLKSLLTGCIILTMAAAVIGLVAGLGYWLSLCAAGMLMLVRSYEKGRMLPGMRLEFLVESLFLLSGVITLAWMVI